MSDDRFLAARVLASSSLAMPLEEALAHMHVRREKPIARPPAPEPTEPDITKRQSMPVSIVDDPEAGFRHRCASLAEQVTMSRLAGDYPVVACRSTGEKSS